MPNIGNLPAGLDLAANGDVTQPYGSHTVAVVKHGLAQLVYGTETLAAVGGGTKVPNINTPVLNGMNGTGAKVVPYVNAFIEGTGLRVEKNWRTKQYVVKGVYSGATLPSVVEDGADLSVQSGTNVVFHEDEPEPELEPVVTLDVPVTTEEVADEGIAGVSIPPAVKTSTKGLPKGFVSVGGIVVEQGHLDTLEDAWQLRQDGEVANVLVTGPSGTAKTQLIRAFAALKQVPFLIVDGGAIRTADDWAGAFRQDPRTKTWAHRWSPFAQVLRAGHPAIILVDEFNRTETPQALNALLGLLTETGQLLVPDANAVLKMPAGVMVAVTANIGPEFVGVLPIDGAVKQRFSYGIRLGFPPEKVETHILQQMTGCSDDLAGRLVRMAADQRVNRDDPGQYPSGTVISTRILLDIARRVVRRGTDPRLAVISTLSGQFEDGDEAALSTVIEAQFPVPVEPEVEVTEVDAPTDEVHAVAGSPVSASGTPLITLGKHWFHGTPSPTCTFFDSAAGRTCGAAANDPVHFGSRP